ncbi:DMT family transporter [Lactobacillus equicursoris]|uniref:DMT family transporter n=1 Tax=Lactobacillus equicursoris TaxID=420645 RepID=UPI003991D5EC
MLAGIMAGITWAAATLLLSRAVAVPLFNRDLEAAFLAPFVCAFFHDSLSCFWLWGQRLVAGQASTWKKWRKDYWWIVLAAAVGGPVGMSGYVLAVKFMGPALGAVACAIFPAVGAVLAYLILGEKLSLFRWLCLLASLAGVYGLSYSGQLTGDKLILGLACAIMCAGGWGLEAVILAKSFKGGIKTGQALQIRQTAAAAVSGMLLVTALQAGGFLGEIVTKGPSKLGLLLVGASGLATASYFCYYKAIEQVGPSKAMALNVTYAAWAFLFTVLAGGWDLVNWQTIFFACLVFAGSILTAADWRALFKRGDN